MSTPLQELTDNRAKLLSYVVRRLGDRVTAEEIVQETYMRVLEQAEKQSLEQPLAYAYRVADSVIYAHARRRDVVVEPIDEEIATTLPLADERADYRERFERFVQALDGLPTMRRTVFVHRHIDGMSRDDIAKRLGISVEAVKKHLVRAMADLAAANISAATLLDDHQRSSKVGRD